MHYSHRVYHLFLVLPRLMLAQEIDGRSARGASCLARQLPDASDSRGVVLLVASFQSGQVE